MPILLRGVAYGNLYLTEKEGGEDFTEEDEELVTLLAAQAAVAIENARLYESATRWSRQLESLNEVGNALVGEIDLPRLLDLIARRLRELIDARLVAIALAGRRASCGSRRPTGRTRRSSSGSRSDRASRRAARVFERGAASGSTRLLDDPEVDQESARRIGATHRRSTCRCSLASARSA